MTLGEISEQLKQMARRQEWLISQVRHLIKAEEIQMATLDDILTEVSEMDDINDSLDAIFAKLQELIAAGQTDPAKLQEALTIITTQKARTKAAIVANTPAAPTA